MRRPQSRFQLFRSRFFWIVIGVGLISIGIVLIVQSIKTDSPRTQQTKTQQSSPKQPTPEPHAPKQPVFDKTAHSLTDPASIWVIANKQRPLQPKEYTPDDLVLPNTKRNGTQYMRREAADALRQLFDAASVAGYSLSALSAYRSYATQVSVYNSEVQAYGQAVADSESARPGFSEHQTGLAVDVGPANGQCPIADCFATMPEGKWLAENAYKFGFIIRYPEGKDAVTGYRYEPWHIRYIGTALAGEMHSQGILTLEEFFGTGAAPNY